MTSSNCAVNRAKLVDEPIVEMILSWKYLDAGISFMKSDLKSDFNGTDIIYYSNGIKRNLNVKRNSSKYYNSPNFTLSINKNNVNVFDNTSFVFIDEVADALYIVDGEDLLKYIMSNASAIQPSKRPSGKDFLIIPKKDILNMIKDNPNSIIKYNKYVARLLSQGRDESLYMNLV